MNKKKHTYSKVWRIAYAMHPPIRKVLQVAGSHKKRGDYLLGHLDAEKHTLADLNAHLISIGFERTKLAWKEPGEILSLRRVDGLKYQWHIRVFDDGEVRGHYELSPESSPLKHLRSSVFNDDKEFLLSLIGNYLKPILSELPAGKVGVDVL
jgi:hypothetical protein